MLVRKNGEWSLYPQKVIYSENGQNKESWALPNVEWWNDIIAKHDHLELINIEEIQLTQEQMNRFEEIKNMPDDFQDVYIEYVLNGNFPEMDFPKGHSFHALKIEKENERLKDELTSQQSAINFLLGV